MFVSVGSVGLIETVKSDGSGLTSLANGGNPVWSPDGSKVAFVDTFNCSQPGCLSVVNADGSNRRPISFPTQFYAAGSQTWFPNSQRLAFIGVTHDVSTGSYHYDVYAMNIDGSGFAQLTNSPTMEKTDAKLSPDGNKIVFTHFQDSLALEVYLMNSDGSGLGVLETPDNSDIWIGSGEWSPDSKMLARGCTESRLVDPEHNRYENFDWMCVIDVAGGTRSRISAEPQDKYDPVSNYRRDEVLETPSWSNDSGRVLYVRHISETAQGQTLQNTATVVEANITGGGEAEKYKTTNGTWVLPAYSPDDSMIALYDWTIPAIVILSDNGQTTFRDFNTLNYSEKIKWRPRPPCDCQSIPRPQTREIQSNWDPVDGFDINWKMTAEVSDNDGLVLKDIRLGDRYMSKQISVPYYNIETGGLPKSRGELRPDGSEGSMRSRLVKYEVIQDSEKLVIEATYVVDRIPINSDSCVHIIQRYEFYKQGFGGKCEPSEALYCSRWKPVVKYKFFGKQLSLTSLTIAQRQENTVENKSQNTVGLFKDCDSPPFCANSGNGFDLGFERKFNPLFNEWYDRAVSNGQSNNLWDNIHQTNDSFLVSEPYFCPLCVVTGGYKVHPGCPECVHSHWRWAKFFGEPFGDGKILDIPAGSKQDFEFGISKYNSTEVDPADFRDSLNNEPIRFYAPLFPEYAFLPDISLPEKVVVWYVGTGKQNSDEFFRFGGFYSASKKVYTIFGPVGFSKSLTSSTDDLTSVVADNLYASGNTTADSFDVNSLDTNVFDPLPPGYTVYGDLARDVETDTEASGPFTTTFTIPSVVSQIDFNKLRILHAEQDPFDPDRAIWVDRTILPPDVQAPDFGAKTIRAKTNLVGPFIVASLVDPPQNTNTADISIGASHSPGQVIGGNELTYTIAITNNGPQSATNIKLASSLPPGSQFVSVNSTQGACKSGQGTIVCKLDDLNVSLNATITVVVKPTDRGGPYPPDTKVITSTTFVRANENDPNINNNVFTESATLLPDTNLAPTVSIVSPISGTVLLGPATSVTLTANANDPDGSISKVDFIDNGDLIATVAEPTSNQYVFNWTNLTYGSHSVIAIATDNQGKTNLSEAANIFVNGPASVSITSPATGSHFQSPANIAISTSASEANGSIAKLELYANGSLLGTATNSGANQYIFSWNGVMSGMYNLTAVATDGNGILTKSPTIPISVYLEANRPPQISIFSPGSGTRYFAPADVYFYATATDTDGSITQVNFYNNGTFIGTGTYAGSDQYTFVWNNPPLGNYNITAIATDDKGVMTISDPVSIIVDAPSALFVVGSTNLTAADNAVKTHLQNLGFTVTIKDASSVAVNEGGDKSVVVISATVSSILGTKLKHTTAPVVTWGSALFPLMGMTTNGNKDFGTSTRQTQLQIINPGHPLAAGLTGTVTVYNSNDTINWGKPGASVVNIATVVGDSTKVAIFIYPRGWQMPNFFTAPANRVGFFMSGTSAASNQNSNAWALFDAAINWATH